MQTTYTNLKESLGIEAIEEKLTQNWKLYVSIALYAVAFYIIAREVVKK